MTSRMYGIKTRCKLSLNLNDTSPNDAQTSSPRVKWTWFKCNKLEINLVKCA